MDSQEKAERIMKNTVAGLVMFLSQVTEESEADIHAHLQTVFPTWDHLWKELQIFLTTQDITHKETSIFNFAKKLPNFSNFKHLLSSSLSLHQEMWNKVYENLLEAKLGLSCST